MIGKAWLIAAGIAATSTLTSFTAKANPIYLAYSLNGGAVTQVGNSGTNGSASTNGTITLGNTGFSIQIQGTGAPLYPNGTLFSNSTSISSTTAGTITLYVGQGGITGNFTSFTTGFSNDSQSSATVTQATYLSNGNVGEQFQLSSLAVTPGMPTTTSTVSTPAGLTNPFSELESYTVTYGAGGGSVSSTLTLTAQAATTVPEPASIALLGMGLGLVSIAKRRKTGGGAAA